MPSCYCGRGFHHLFALQQHQQAKRHGYCFPCRRFFNSENALDTHRSAKHFYQCDTCDSVFASEEARQKHQIAKFHCYCHECRRFFSNTDALDQHMASSIHATQFHCCDCNRDFCTERALDQHLDDKIHTPLASARFSESDLTCMTCNKTFKNERALEQHQDSVIHHPIGKIKCVGDSRCHKWFTSPSAMIHHLESGTCCSGITRDKLNTLVRSNDEQSLISSGDGWEVVNRLTSENDSNTSSFGNGSVMTPNSESSSVPGGVGLLTPRSDEPSIDLTEYFFNKLTISGKPFCPQCQKSFGSYGALQNHIASAAHSTVRFHCPLSLTAPSLGLAEANAATKQFSTLSGMAQHLESGVCVGGKAVLRTAIGYVEEQLRESGLKDWRLLN